MVTILNNVLVLITQSHLSTAQDSSSFKHLNDMCMFMYVTPTFITEVFHLVTQVKLFL